jgi:hypothetical protein
VQALSSIDRQIRGWGDAFKDVDQRLEFSQLDQEIQKVVGQFVGRFFKAAPDIMTPERMRALGIALLADTPAVSS